MHGLNIGTGEKLVPFSLRAGPSSASWAGKRASTSETFPRPSPLRLAAAG